MPLWTVVPSDPLGPGAKRMSPVSIHSCCCCPVGRAGAEWWCERWLDGRVGSVPCQVSPATHMVGDSALCLWVPTTRAGSQSACAVRSCSLWQLMSGRLFRTEKVLRSEWIPGGVFLVFLGLIWFFFVQDVKVLFSDFELGEAGVLFQCWREEPQIPLPILSWHIVFLLLS